MHFVVSTNVVLTVTITRSRACIREAEITQVDDVSSVAQATYAAKVNMIDRSVYSSKPRFRGAFQLKAALGRGGHANDRGCLVRPSLRVRNWHCDRCFRGGRDGIPCSEDKR